MRLAGDDNLYPKIEWIEKVEYLEMNLDSKQSLGEHLGSAKTRVPRRILQIYSIFDNRTLSLKADEML